MNKLIIVMSLSISYSLSAGILNSIGSIDKHTQFSLYFNSETNSGLVEIRNKLGTAEQYPIQCVDVEGDSPILANNNLKIIIEKGIFFIPRRYSAEKALFNEKPITITRAEDIAEVALKKERLFNKCTIL